MTKGPKLTMIDCKAPPEIRQVILSVHELNARERYHTAPTPADTVRFQQATKRMVTSKLLRGIEKFVHYDVDMVDQHITAKIYLPYVADDVLKNAQRSAKLWMDSSDKWRLMYSACEVEKAKLKEVINQFNALPWYKRLFRRIEL